MKKLITSSVFILVLCASFLVAQEKKAGKIIMDLYASIDAGGAKLVAEFLVLFLVMSIIPSIAIAELGIRGKVATTLFDFASKGTAAEAGTS